MSEPPDLGVAVRERVVFDTSALLSRWAPELTAAAYQGLCDASWSSWIVGELARKRTEWVAERAAREGVALTELRRRLHDSRERVNALLRDLSEILRSVDYATAGDADLSWLSDPDDWPVMQTALAARADVLVTENSTDFPLGERRHGVLLLSSSAFLSTLYARFPDAEAAVRSYLHERSDPGRTC